MARRVLITGICGFSGRYMCQYLSTLQEHLEIIGVDITDAPTVGCDSFHKTDICSAGKVAELFRQSKPDYVIHLAGIFGTNDPQAIYRSNILSMTAILEAALEAARAAIIVAAGSAAEYGRIDPELMPVDEETPCLPVTPYGLSKKLATQAAMYYHRVYDIAVMCVRPFQLIGNGVTSRLAPGAFAKQLRQTVESGSKVMKVGNLQTSRDFLDVRDAVEAIWALCQKPAPGQVFNLCSGIPTRIADLLQMMIDYCQADVRVEADLARFRGSNDVSQIYGSFEKLKNHCGWSPKRSLGESISEMLK